MPIDIDVNTEESLRSLTQAIRTAYLITGTAAPAEAAVTEAIDRWHPKDGVRSLLEAAVESAATKSGEVGGAEWPLKAELRNVARLPRNARLCFVLRILNGNV